jgi:lysozyme
VSEPRKPSAPGNAIAAILASCALATPLVVASEGWVTRTYADPIGKLTACAGVTNGVVAGRTYSDEECSAMTSQAIVEHGVKIAPCIKVPIPNASRAAFTSFAYNAGPTAFCTSTMVRKLNAGDLAGACAELSRWTLAAGKPLPGLVKRRAAERALCEQGLKSPG